MKEILERTAHFYNWEIRGRGWIEYPYPVPLEPVFRPYTWQVPQRRVVQVDDGRRHTFLSELLEGCQGRSILTTLAAV